MSERAAGEVRTYTLEAWRAEGRRRFGAAFDRWRFVCPLCAHVAEVGDFRPYASKGATPDSATQHLEALAIEVTRQRRAGQRLRETPTRLRSTRLTVYAPPADARPEVTP